MTNDDVNRMVLALTESFGSVERPGFDKDAERARLFERAHQSISIIADKLQAEQSIGFELNVIVYAMGLFGGKEAEAVRGIAASLGAALGVRLVALAA